jgi:DNA-binding protein HU-beta
MNKDALIEVMRQKGNLSRKAAEELFAVLEETIIDALRRGEEVSISGFGSFQVLKRKSRRGVNPRTGKPITIPEVRVAKFRPGKNLKAAVK